MNFNIIFRDSRIYLGKLNFKLQYQNSLLVITVCIVIKKPNTTKKMKLSFMTHTMFMCFANYYYLMTECQQIFDITIISTVTTLLLRDD